jgi:hypothetical protein
MLCTAADMCKEGLALPADSTGTSTSSKLVCGSAANTPLATEQGGDLWCLLFCGVCMCVACVPLRMDIASSYGSSQIARESCWQGMQRAGWCSVAATFRDVCAYYARRCVAVVRYNSVITVTYPEPWAFPL